MKTQLTSISVVVLALCACGPGAQISGGKQGAAEALYAMSGPTKAGADKLASGVDFGLNFNVACAEGGSVNLHAFGISFDTSLGVSVSQSFSADYKNCGVRTKLGVAGLSGTIAVNQGTTVINSNVQVHQTLKGKLNWGGACSDFLDVDVLEKVDVVALTATTGSVDVVIKGTLSDTSGTYTYDESVTVSPGTVSVEMAASTKK